MMGLWACILVKGRAGRAKVARALILSALIIIIE